jgi:hypothetical protein
MREATVASHRFDHLPFGMVPSDMNQLVKLTTSHHESRDVLMVVIQYPLDLHEDGDP